MTYRRPPRGVTGDGGNVPARQTDGDWRDLRLRSCNPRLDLFLEDVERQRPGAENLVVEGPDVELRTELLLRPFAQLEDLQLAHLVTQGLAGPGDVAVGLALDVRLVDGRVRVEVVDHLLARPLLRVQTGIHDEADRSPDLSLQVPVVAVRIREGVD